MIASDDKTHMTLDVDDQKEKATMEASRLKKSSSNLSHSNLTLANSSTVTVNNGNSELKKELKSVVLDRDQRLVL